MNEKKELRRELLAKRQNLSGRAERLSKIHRFLLSYLEEEGKDVKNLGFYSPIRDEPEIEEAVADWLNSKNGRKAALPFIRKGAMAYCRWEPGMEMEKGKFDILEPVLKEEVECDAVLIPCVGFSSDLYRLGYGGGWFDRFLSVHPEIRKIGVAFECSLLEKFPVEPFDIPLSAVITESAVRKEPSRT